MEERKREIYTNNNVEALANLTNLKNIVLNDDFKSKLRIYREVNGGSRTLKDINANIEKYGNMIENILADAGKLIQKEEKEDQVLKQATGNDNAITSFANANKAEINQLNQLKSTYEGYKTMSSKAMNEFKARQNFLGLFDQSNPDFSQFIAVPALDSFIANNKEDIAKMKGMVDGVQKMINGFIKPSHDGIMQKLDQINIDQLTSKIVMREASQTEVFQNINDQFGNQFTTFEDQTSKASQVFEKLRALAVGLNSKGCPLQSSNSLDSLVSSLSFYIEYHTRVGNCAGYYGMIHAELERVLNILKDSASARALNREHIIEDAKNRANRFNQIANGAMNFGRNIANSVWGNNQPSQFGGNPYGQGNGYQFRPNNGGNQGFGGNNNNPGFGFGNGNNQGGFGNMHHPGNGFGGSGFGHRQNPYGGNNGGRGW